ncbi:MAG: hypothetical protein K2I19_02425, partial [Muribaculaceae bacterium]|nr:hypothetical protein [Muribaculaceae bacterium]
LPLCANTSARRLTAPVLTNIGEPALRKVRATTTEKMAAKFFLQKKHEKKCEKYLQVKKKSYICTYCSSNKQNSLVL